MNNLSIALYAIDVIGNLDTIITMTAVFSGILLIMGFFFKMITSDRDCRSEISMNDTAKAIIKNMIPVFIVATLFGVVIPKRDTVRLIVASEFGESLYKSEDVQEVINPAKKALKKWLNDYTKDAK